jgi:hypothetical protein
VVPNATDATRQVIEIKGSRKSKTALIMPRSKTDNFNRAITALMPDEAYARLQQALVDDPELGDLIPGTGGMRKVRWTLGGKGKRGGARVIYFWRDRAAQIIFLMVYGKGVKTDLTAGEKRQLKQAAEAFK